MQAVDDELYIPEATRPTTIRAAVSALIRRERMLTTPGELLVDIGAQVEPSTVVAEGEGFGGVRVVEVGSVLGLSGQMLDKALLVKPGDMVQPNQPLAVGRRLFRRQEVVAPTAGTVLAVDDHGRMLLSTVGEPVQLLAGLRGTVTNVIPHMGVVIEGVVGLVQGVWGNGVGARYGVLRVLVSKSGEEAEAERIEAGARDSIVVVGTTVSRQGLENAAAVQVRGLIVGAIPAELRPLAQTMPFPIMVTEGFGKLPIAGDLFDLILEANGREVVLDGRYQMRFGRILPELILLPRTHQAPPLPDLGMLRTGQLVRVVAAPAMGAVGLVSEVDAGRLRTESGIPMPACEVTLISGEKIQVPYTNLERIG